MDYALLIETNEGESTSKAGFQGKTSKKQFSKWHPTTFWYKKGVKWDIALLSKTSKNPSKITVFSK